MGKRKYTPDRAAAVAVDILERARHFVATGWTQNASRRDENGGVYVSNCPSVALRCATGAIDDAVSDLHFIRPARSQARIVNIIIEVFIEANGWRARKSTQARRYDVQKWNDHADQTQEQVVAAFDLAIDASKKRAGRE